MPGDTKIKRSPNGGWIDIDRPDNRYAARWQARDARRKRVQYYVQQGAPVPGGGATTGALSTYSVPTPAPVPSNQPPVDLTGLQSRLFSRMTVRQGVSASDALSVIKTHGYNQAASYGHMREAGASHPEAFQIVNIGLPNVSLAYGIARSNGKDHTTALREALTDALDD